MAKNKRKHERVDAYWESTIRMYLRNSGRKHHVRLINCSEAGLCIEVPMEITEFFEGDRINLLFQAGQETCVFTATVRWAAPYRPALAKGKVDVRRYGAKIDRRTITNSGLYLDYVRFLFLKSRFSFGKPSGRSSKIP